MYNKLTREMIDEAFAKVHEKTKDREWIIYGNAEFHKQLEEALEDYIKSYSWVEKAEEEVKKDWKDDIASAITFGTYSGGMVNPFKNRTV